LEGAIHPPPNPRAIAFVDGQNLFHAARKAFGRSYPDFDIHALASCVCETAGWTLAQTRFYTGLHHPEANRFWHDFWLAKLAIMRGQGVEVYTRPVRYRVKTVRLPDGKEHTFQAGEEKGIDVRIALDVIRCALQREYDVAVIFSQDQDLADVALEIRAIAREQNRWIKVACAFPVGPGSHHRRGIERTDWILIDQAVYESCLDPNEYRT
jgi:uncharacterized LabA/DUF88 family protein